MNKSVPLFEKRMPHVSMRDWTRNIQQLQHEARLRRAQSYELRQRATQLRNETDVTTRWDYRLNSNHLRDRIYEVSAWREKQRFCRENVRTEMNTLKEEKNSTELCLESLQVPLMVVSHCLSNRDDRRQTELTHDHLDIELKKELALLEHNKKLLMDACHSGWEKINELTNIYNRLDHEITNKDETLSLDNMVRDLNTESACISHKFDPTRIPSESMTEQGYEDCIENTIKIAEQLMRESKCVRETMFRTREQAKNQMYEQNQFVEHIMRRRVYDIQRARNEMEWQKDKIEQNMQKVSQEISNLQAALQAKVAPSKVVETRLEARTRRPVLELVRDKVQDGLIEEFGRIKLSQSMLQQKLDDALSTYHGMCNHWDRLRRDLDNKSHALETDRRLMEIRKPLHLPEDSQLARNVGYCHMNEEIAKDL